MTANPTDSPPRSGSSRLRFELISASVLVAFGLFGLPALIFWVGSSLLGPYGNGQSGSLSGFYGDFFGDLASGSIRAWTIFAGPLILIWLLRLIFLRRPSENPSGEADSDTTPPQNQAREAPGGRRVEPRVTLD